MSVLDLLKGCPLFYELYPKEIEKLASHCNVLTFNDGDYIVKDQEEGNEVYVILEGDAVIEKKLPHGTKRIAELHQGDVFGEMVLIDEKTRSADIKATKKSFVLEIPYDSIYVMFQKEPRIFGLLLLNLSRLIAQRLRMANKTIVDLQTKLTG